MALALQHKEPSKEDGEPRSKEMLAKYKESLPLISVSSTKKIPLCSRARHSLCLEGNVFSSRDAKVAAGSPARARRAGGVQLVRLKGKI